VRGAQGRLRDDRNLNKTGPVPVFVCLVRLC
jgi:hypothetical protein